jgi:hypothetical protein
MADLDRPLNPSRTATVGCRGAGGFSKSSGLFVEEQL